MGSLKKNSNTIAISAIITTVLFAYLPLLVRFSLRNDQINYFLPVRMFMSDAFNHKEYMYWNPFVSGSYPIHSDMQGPVWNPIVIIFSWMFNYNSSLLSVELIVYYLIGTIGCYFFSKNFTSNTYSRYIIAISYGCGGFATSIMEFMGWVASFAFLPWAIHFFIKVLKTKNFSDGVKLSISLWLLLTSGYPSFLIFLGYGFTGAYLCYSYSKYLQKKTDDVFSTFKIFLISLICFIALSLPAIHSFIEYIPFYVRGNKATLGQLNSESFSLRYPISFIFSGGGSFLDNNIYIGIIPFLLLWGINIRKQGNTLKNGFLIFAFLLTFLFSIGRSTPFRIWCADYLPLLGKFGFSHSVRVFLLFPIFIWIAPQLDTLFSPETNAQNIRKLRSSALTCAIILLTFLVIEFQHIQFKNTLIRSFYYISAGWQLFFLIALFSLKYIYTSAFKICSIIALDLIITVLSVAPLSGLSKTPNSVYNQFADNFYKPRTNEILLYPNLRNKQALNVDLHSEINAWKLIPRNDFSSNTRLDTLYRFMQDPKNFDFLYSKPFVFTEDNINIEVKNLELGYNYINADIYTKDTASLIIQQSFHQRWRSKHPENSISDYKAILLKVKLNAGENKLRLYYYKKDLLIESIISLSVLLFLISNIIYTYYKKKNHL